MSRFTFEYCLVKYVHDPSAGEMLNIGVLAFSEATKEIVGKFEIRYDRLSSAFKNFNGDHYRFVVRNLEHTISQVNERIKQSLFPSEFKRIEQVFRSIVPDSGLSIQFGSGLAGITADLEEEAERIFYRLITSQAPQKEKKSRSDDEVWTVYNKSLSRHKITKYLKPKHFSSENYDFKFDHTFKNEKHHVLNPVNMDYANSKSMQVKAIKLLGQSFSLSENPDIGKLYLLLGAPGESSHNKAYVKAKNLLSKIPIKKEMIEENDAEDFADHLSDVMKNHGVFDQ